jgi:hypothetical protein
LNNLKINVFRLVDGKVTTIYNTKERNENVVNLLLIYDNNGNSHYVWIKDLAKLICKNKNKLYLLSMLICYI